MQKSSNLTIIAGEYLGIMEATIFRKLTLRKAWGLAGLHWGVIEIGESDPVR